MHFKDSKTNRSRTYGSDPFTLIGLLEMLGKSTSKEICELVFTQCSFMEIHMAPLKVRAHACTEMEIEKLDVAAHLQTWRIRGSPRASS